MLNGLKAVMTDVELIKSKLLSKASRNKKNPDNEKQDLEWEIKSLRSRYAREWDKWLYWWKRDDVRFIFKNKEDNPLELLLDVFYLKENKDKSTTTEELHKGQNKQFFKAFETKFLANKKDAKKNFLKLRKLQKIFEDWFNDYKTYNALGLILNAGIYNKNNNKIEFLVEINSIEEKELLDYAKWSVVGVTIEEYKNKEEKDNKVNIVLENLSGKYVYFEAKEEANKQLLRMNVEFDNKLKRKFDFSIWNNKSLEHIHAKSKEKDLKDFTDKEITEFDEFTNTNNYSVHCIGNLVLLDKNDNSALGPKNFICKKEILFNLENLNDENKELRKSLALLHTLSVFSKSEWTEEQIKKNREKMLENIRTTYNISEENK